MKLIDGFYWPETDRDCHVVCQNQLNDVNYALKYTKETKICVQAGGNVGVWPKHLSTIFDVVYTFEPNPENFNCLARNVPQHNVVKFNAGLGQSHDMVTVKSPEPGLDLNCGAYQVHDGGFIPILRIDDLNLPSCDLIYLDIEGYEYFAIQGALETIKKFKPVIALEDKPLPKMYGIEVGQTAEYLCKEHGYEVVERIHRDIILCYQSFV